MKKSKPSKDETKSTIQINRNRSSGKKRQDLFAKFRNTEHPLDDIFPVETKTSTPTSTPTTVDTNTQTNEDFPVAPVNNFQKVTNTITKQAIPQRLFRTGKTKEIYDVLYSLTRGALVPQRSINISKPKLRQLTGVGSRVTLDTCLGYLEIVNLVRITTNHTGQHEGNEYEVFTPEETLLTTPTSTPTSRGGRHALTLGVVPRLVSRRGRGGLNSTKHYTSEIPNTSFKTIENNDDEAFAAMLEILKNGSEKVSGKATQKSDSAKWKEFAELIVMELEIAAARTNSISNVPAFLTEHLRRRLLSKSVISESKVKKSLPLRESIEPKSKDVEIYQAEPLSKEGRATVLKTVREYLEKGHNEFIMSFQDTYTKEDWDWLMKELNVENKK